MPDAATQVTTAAALVEIALPTNAPGLSAHDLRNLGKAHPNDPADLFSMAVLALRLSGGANGVSRLHGEVSREMWRGVWPGAPVEEVPIQSVTNGVHIPSWLSGEMTTLLDRYLDWVVRSSAKTVVSACGNSGTFANNPGAGFNQIAVGNFDDKGTPLWSDDRMNPTSSWMNPSTGVETPQVVAPGKKFCSLVAPTAAAGVLIHQQQAWPVFSVPGMLGEPMVYEPMTVLADSGGDGLGFTASRVVGVLEGAALKGVSTLELKAMFS